MSSRVHILVKGARQNNLKSLNLRLPLNEFIVVTGVSGSGKSSLAFDTIYSEGQRRYVETFSPYARQFLDRMDKPQADRIEGIPPAIAIDQTNPVRTSRSTVGTMTELNDHIKLLFARAALLYCRGCGKPVCRDTPETIYHQLIAIKLPTEEPNVLITFPVSVPDNFSDQEIKDLLEKQGYTKIHRQQGSLLEVIQDRVRLVQRRRQRIMESLETALKVGRGRVYVHFLEAQPKTQATWRFSSDLHCPDCNIHYCDPLPSLFSFNSPIGACETCRGFGRMMGIDYALVIPDERKTLAEGAIKPWLSASYRECQDDMMRFADARGIPTDVPWQKLTKAQQRWILEGEGEWDEGLWYGVQRFFEWLETKSYKMHIRVLLSKYRAYTTCPTCKGARLKAEALWWRLGTQANADRAIARNRRFKPDSVTMSDTQYLTLPGLTLHDLMLLPIDSCQQYFNSLRLPAPLDEATELLLTEIQTRLDYLVKVGLGYLTLDRQSRTLSGGEVQRINLTTALGTSLVNTLFVLDEPSIGLHPRDMQRIIELLHRLRDAGNSLIVVEHDPQVMLAADRILDLGPGPGERGGNIVFFGAPHELLRSRRSLTAHYLTGRRTVFSESTLPDPPADAVPHHLEILGAAEHNLKNIDVKIPLNRLVCITGVSGSGKSTLMQDVCYNALNKVKGSPKNPPGQYRALRGDKHIQEVVLVDQSPIGKTTRSNPASYVGALNAIRKLFAKEPLAVERGYTAGTFSFNSGTGRCPTCSGNGFEHVEMQFLSDVYLRCPDCDGRRYRTEVLEVKLITSRTARINNIGHLNRRSWELSERQNQSEGKPKSIADVLTMTVAQAIEFFAQYPDVSGALEPLEAVGLDYIKLGQPVPTLSGGEAQRLKLAGYLAKARGQRVSSSGNLFLLDEPTTGLHFNDIAKLLQALRQLLEEGHSVVVIEHNLDVIRASDWVIDLGPEGGDAGGEIVCIGTPQEVAQCERSHTGAALRHHLTAASLKASAWTENPIPNHITMKVAELPSNHGTDLNSAIRIHNAREHNLQNVDIRIPRNQLTVITGISGSGKSTVAFDILFAEGQRRYLESLNAYARQFVQPAGRPDVDAIFSIPPTVAIEQRTSRGGHKSTVATMTEIYHFLRLLFVKLGIQYCPDCELPIKPQTREAILAKIMRDHRGQRVSLLAPLVAARKGYYTDLAKWAAGKGFSYLRVDGELMPTDNWPRLDRFKEHNIELPLGEISINPTAEAELRELLDQALDLGKDVVKLTPNYLINGAKASGPSPSEVLFSTRRACPGCGRSFEALDPRLFSFNSKHGWCEHCYGTGLKLDSFDADQMGEELHWNQRWKVHEKECPACNGQRLRPESLTVRWRNRSIAEITQLSVADAETVFRTLKLEGREATIGHDVLAELHARLRFLKQVGLSYLTLDRSAPTLSGGEAQRIRLAAQLGSNLRGVCYILDEPTIGLHARDNQRLLTTLKRLKNKGNTLVVVEHDEETIRSAEHIIDLGPGAGVNGGRVVAEGTVEELANNENSITGQYLNKPLEHPLLEQRRPANIDKEKEFVLEIHNASLNNLKNLKVIIPLQRLVCVTGVSGSGKSTLVREVLHENLHQLLSKKRSQESNQSNKELHGCKAITGWQAIRRVLEVEQTPIGKTPRSCPATYVGFWDHIRQLFAKTAEARMRGYGPGRFSFNLKGGRCDACEGQGIKKIEMSFLPDVAVTCEVCRGARFNSETLAVQFKNKNIANVLAMSVDEAEGFFATHTPIHHALRLLQDVGLGYLTLGQQSPTLSGGEAQRIKLVTELAKAKPVERTESLLPGKKLLRQTNTNNHTLYILDEPTIGLHIADVKKLIRVLHRLVRVGNTVVIIEHNLDIIAEADWVIDLGPEGGDNGGCIVAEGLPEDLARIKKGSYTAKFLTGFLKERSRNPRQNDVTIA